MRATDSYCTVRKTVTCPTGARGCVFYIVLPIPIIIIGAE